MHGLSKRIIFLLIAALLLSTAGITLAHAADHDGWYLVRPGDYLTQIARNFGVKIDDIRSASKLESDTLQPGQRLDVPKPFRRTSVHDVLWRRPFHGRRGEILRPFGPARENNLDLLRTGVDMAYPPGSRVYAPANAMVRYVGHQDGYGTIIILVHGAHFMTVLGPFSENGLKIEEGKLVKGGDPLGLTGKPAEGGRPYLHLELRHKNKAIDPARLLD